MALSDTSSKNTIFKILHWQGRLPHVAMEGAEGGDIPFRIKLKKNSRKVNI